MSTIDGVRIKLLREIIGDQGSVIHGLREDDEEYAGFGEAYFSTVEQSKIKGWKKHKIMKLNLIVVDGEITFVLYDDRSNSPTYGEFFEARLSSSKPERLSVPPRVWMAFKGESKNINKVLNLASITHDPAEQENINLDQINYPWSL